MVIMATTMLIWVSQSIAQIAAPFQTIPRQSDASGRVNHVVLALDVALPNDNLAEVHFATIRHFFFAGERIRVYGGVGTLKAENPLNNGFTAGIGGGWALLQADRPWRPGFDALTGVSYTDLDHPSRADFTQVDIPLGVAGTIFGPTPIGINITAWAATRGHLRVSDRLDGGDGTASDVGIGFSAGFSVESLNVAGLRVGADWLILSDQHPGDSLHEFVLAVGLQLRIEHVLNLPTTL
jgi:hypothetical protein